MDMSIRDRIRKRRDEDDDDLMLLILPALHHLGYLGGRERQPQHTSLLTGAEKRLCSGPFRSPTQLRSFGHQAAPPMDALMANYTSGSDDDDEQQAPVAGAAPAPEPQEASGLLPPPPLDLLQPPNFVDYSTLAQGSRIRSFPHVEGNYPLHVYIPVVIPSAARKQLTLVMRRAASLVPDLYAVDADYALSELCKDEQKLERVLLGREFHVSLGRTVGIQVHQIDSIVAMLRQKFQSQQRYCMDFNKWEHFVNDDSTRSFLSLEVTKTGLPEISKQIHMVDEVYRLHGLPEFYKNPRPHISLVWALGDFSSKLKQATREIEKFQNSISSSKNCNLRCNFSRIVCKVGKKVYGICKISD